MRKLLTLFALALSIADLMAADPTAGQMLFQRRKTSDAGFEPFGVSLVTGKVFGWDGSAVVMTDGSSGTAWGGIGGTLSDQTDLQEALDAKLDTNGDGSGLTGLTISQITDLATSGVARGAVQLLNTSDGTSALSYSTSGGWLLSDPTSFRSQLGISSLFVPQTRTVNGHALSSNVTVTSADLGLATVATTGAYSDLIGLPTLGSLASLNSVGSAQITDGSITNADISAGAAIALSKLATSGTINATTVNGTTLSGTTVTAVTLFNFPNLTAPTGGRQLGMGATGKQMVYTETGSTTQHTIVDLSETQTLTNKTISGAVNTLTVRPADITQAGATTGQALTWSGTAWAPATISGGAASGWLYKTTNYTAVAGDRIFADTYSGSFNITLPAGGTAGDVVTIQGWDGESWPHALTVLAGSGNTINGGLSSVISGTDFAGKLLLFSCEGAGDWRFNSYLSESGTAKILNDRRLDQFAAPSSDAANATTSHPGLLPTLSGNAADFLNGNGGWSPSIDPANPPAWGDTTPNSGGFTSLSATGNFVFTGSLISLVGTGTAPPSYTYGLFPYSGVGLGISSQTNMIGFTGPTGDQFAQVGNSADKTWFSGLALKNIGSDPTPVSGQIFLYAKSGEAYVEDESGNVTLFSPHSKKGPPALYDSALDAVGDSINLYTGLTTWTNEARKGAQLPNAVYLETIEDRCARTGETFDIGWQFHETKRVEDSIKAHTAWAERKAAWEATAAKDKDGNLLPFTEQEPEIHVFEPVPQAVLDQIATIPAKLAAQKVAFETPPINRRQLRLQLHAMGVLAQVETLVTAANSTELKIWWEDTTEFHRDHPLVAQFAAQLGLNNEQVDAIWKLAHDL